VRFFVIGLIALLTAVYQTAFSGFAIGKTL